jgi:hypothetical protein
MRKIEEIARDLSRCLWSFTSNYPGSPYREEAERVFQEFTEWEKREVRWYSTQMDKSWDNLYKEVFMIINNEEKSSGEIAGQVTEILRLFRIFHASGDTNDKLDQILNLVNGLKGSAGR